MKTPADFDALRGAVNRRVFLISAGYVAAVIGIPWLAGCGSTEPPKPAKLSPTPSQPVKEPGVSKNLRLTLLVLLAYRQDMLEPADREDIARKLAGSEFAQQVNARIDRAINDSADQVAIANGDDLPDPDQVATYIEGALGPAELKEFELHCLQNDAALAEVAVCHQILGDLLKTVSKPQPLFDAALPERLKKVLTKQLEAKKQTFGPLP